MYQNPRNQKKQWGLYYNSAGTCPVYTITVAVRVHSDRDRIAICRLDSRSGCCDFRIFNYSEIARTNMRRRDIGNFFQLKFEFSLGMSRGFYVWLDRSAVYCVIPLTIGVIGVQGKWQFFPPATCYCPLQGVRPKFFAACLFLDKIFLLKTYIFHFLFICFSA